jgi:magnesium transporter
MRMYVLNQHGLQSEVNEDNLAEFHEAETGVIWIDVHHPTPKSVGKLQEVMNLHPLAVEDAFHQRERPKFEEYPNHMFIVLNDIVLRHHELEFPELDIFVGADYVITVHYRCYEKMERVRERLQNSEIKRPFTTAHIFHTIVDTIVDGYFFPLNLIDDELDAMVERIIEKPSAAIQARLFELKRMLHRTWFVLGYERDLLNMVLRHESKFDAGADILQYYMRDVQDHLTLVTDIVISHRENLNSIIDLYISSTQMQLNVIVNRLTVITIIVGVLTVISGFYGMNFDSTWPPFEIPWGVPFVIGTMIVSGVVIAWLLRRWRVY